MKTDRSVFAINYETGIIRTISANLMAKTYEIVVDAFDHCRPSLKRETNLTIVVNGTDPHAPEFEQFVYDATVLEKAANGTVVTRVIAKDPYPDQAGQIMYGLPGTSVGTEAEPFNIDPSSGEIRVAGRLDYETQREYQLMNEASDHADFVQTGMTVVRIRVKDVNDNAPVFDPLPDWIFVSSVKQPPSAAFLHVRATNRDSQNSGGGGGGDSISFLIDPPSQYFEFEGDAFRVKNRLEPGEYNVTLLARDGGDSTLSTSRGRGRYGR